MKTDASQAWEKRQEVAKRRRELRARAIAHKGGKCEICGYDQSPAAFDFHHLDPTEKDFAISERMTSWAVIEKELQKCVLLCCRCHREVHDGWHARYLELGNSERGGYFEDAPTFEDELQVD